MRWNHGLDNPRDRILALIWGPLAICVVCYFGSLLWELYIHDDWAILWNPPYGWSATDEMELGPRSLNATR